MEKKIEKVVEYYKGEKIKFEGEYLNDENGKEKDLMKMEKLFMKLIMVKKQVKKIILMMN